MNQLPAQIIFNGNLRLGRIDVNKYDFGCYEPITAEKAGASIEYFIKKMSRRLFGTKRILSGETLNYIGMIEGDPQPNKFGGTRYHFHIGVSGIPAQYDLIQFSKEMKQVWEQGKWGYRHTLAEPCYGDQWKTYVLKYFSPLKTEHFVTNFPFRRD